MSSSSVKTAAGYIRSMVANEAKGWGDNDNTLRRLGTKYNLNYWTANNILIGRAKTVEAGVFDRIREAFIDNCKSHAARLIHEAEMAERVGHRNEKLTEMADRLRNLLGQLEDGENAKEGNLR